MLVQVDTYDCLGTACVTDVAEDDTDDLKTYAHNSRTLCPNCSTAEKLDSYKNLLSKVSLEFQRTKNFFEETYMLPIVGMIRTGWFSVIICSQGSPCRGWSD